MKGRRKGREGRREEGRKGVTLRCFKEQSGRFLSRESPFYNLTAIPLTAPSVSATFALKMTCTLALEMKNTTFLDSIVCENIIRDIVCENIIRESPAK